MRERAQVFDPRQVMQRPDFEIFHYRNQEQPGVALHHHDFYEVYFFLGGRVEYRVEGQLLLLQPGDLLLINPMELHQVTVRSTDTLYERIVLWIDPGYLAQLSGGGDSLSRCFDSRLPGHTNLLRPTSALRSELTMLLAQIVRERYSEEYAGGAYATGVFMQFMAALNRAVLRAEYRPEERAVSTLVDGVLQHISRHFDQELTLDSLSQRFYVSKYHLSHEFSRHTGISLHRYVTLKRLQIARQMLASGDAPGEVCMRCGFGDYASFYRAFRAQYGVSPKDCLTGEHR